MHWRPVEKSNWPALKVCIPARVDWFKLEFIQSLYAFKAIARERKYLMDYNDRTATTNIPANISH